MRKPTSIIANITIALLLQCIISPACCKTRVHLDAQDAKSGAVSVAAAVPPSNLEHGCAVERDSISALQLIDADATSSSSSIDDLEHVGLDVKIPVDYDSVANVFLSSDSDFFAETLFRRSCRYTNITVGPWGGAPNLAARGDENDAAASCGPVRQTSYLMPKSRLTGAYMAYQTQQLLHHDDKHFVVRFRTETPDAPFGSKFVAWTQVKVMSEADNTIRLVCSVEPEYPKGKPMSFIANQIRNGMRSGTGDFFDTLSRAIQSEL